MFKLGIVINITWGGEVAELVSTLDVNSEEGRFETLQ
jgi:hypothetical protein